MHPDSTIAALQRELAGLDTKAPDHEERKQAIHAEIAHASGLPKPSVTAGNPNTVVDRTAVYVEALKRELRTSPKGRQDEIAAEIARIESETRGRNDALAKEAKAQSKEEAEADDGEEDEDVENDENLTAEEIEERKQARTGNGVEQARSAPTPGKPTPAVPEKE